MEPCCKDCYKEVRLGARRSAQVIVPLVPDLVRPRSVIDVGCALGTWLAVFKEHGVEDIWGVDCEQVDSSLLETPEDRFTALDLERPLQMKRRFDLVLSLEVAEHLPGSCAEDFVSSLTELGPVVLFSAAAPFQGGNHHLNEQWPEYWAELFQERNYLPVDCLRRKIWQNESVDWWYAQNI